MILKNYLITYIKIKSDIAGLTRFTFVNVKVLFSDF